MAQSLHRDTEPVGVVLKELEKLELEYEGVGHTDRELLDNPLLVVECSLEEALELLREYEHRLDIWEDGWRGGDGRIKSNVKKSVLSYCRHRRQRG